MDNEQLNCFLSAARNLSFTKAAGECHVVQTTVSRQIAALEREIGTPLFERRGRSLSLTASGRYLLNAAGNYNSQYERLIRDCRLADANNNAPLLLRTGPFESYLLTGLLTRFVRQTAPSGMLSCNTNSYNILSAKLRQGDLSIAFCSLRCAATGSPTLTVTPIYRKPWLVCAAQASPFWALPKKQQSRLENQMVVLATDPMFDEVEPYCISRGLGQAGFIPASLLPTQLMMTRAGAGVMLVPPWMAGELPPDLRAEDLLEVPFAPTIAMVTNPARSRPGLSQLIRLCREYFASSMEEL